MALERVSSRKFARFKRSSDEDDKIPNYPVFIKSEYLGTQSSKKILSESIGVEGELIQRRLTEHLVTEWGLGGGVGGNF